MGTRQISRVLSGLLIGCIAAAQGVDEYQVKAGFVSGFASFVEWPAETFSRPDEPLVICVLGRNPFGTALAGFANGRSAGSHALSVRGIQDAGSAAGCQIVFVAASEHLRLRSILASIRGQSILTVGDTNDFIAEGGVANLRLENGRVRIEINPEAAKARNLRISSKLMQLAKIVK